MADEEHYQAMYITLSNEEFAVLQQIVLDFVHAEAPEGITPIIEAVCLKVGVPSQPTVLNTFPPMRPNIG